MPLVSNVLPGRHRPDRYLAAAAESPDLGDLPRYWPQACPIVGTRMPSLIGADRELRSW
jgi:hypothetical protein